MSDFSQNANLIIPSCKYALVIGVSNYQKSAKPREDLPNASTDRAAMVKLLKRFGYNITTNTEENTGDGIVTVDFVN